MDRENKNGEEEEEVIKKIWDCGSPLYDSYELVAITNIIERHLVLLPYLSGSRKDDVATTHPQLCLFPSPVTPPADAAAGGGGGGKWVGLLSEILEGLMWKREIDIERKHKGEKLQSGVACFLLRMRNSWKKLKDEFLKKGKF